MEYDAVIFCNGPDLEKEAEPVIDKGFQVVINHAIKRVKFTKPYYFVHEPFEEFVRIRSSDALCHDVPWIPGEGRDGLDPDAYPHLMYLPCTMFTALHFCICFGCRNIYAAGCNLKYWPDGNYNLGLKRNPDLNIFEDTIQRFKHVIIPELERLDISFTSNALSWKPGDPTPPKCYVK